MKITAAVLLLSVSATLFAQGNPGGQGPGNRTLRMQREELCMEFEQRLAAAQMEMETFERGDMQRVSQQLMRVDSDLDIIMQNTASLMARRDSLMASVDGLSREKAALADSRRGTQVQLESVDRQLSQMRTDMDRHARLATVRGQDMRFHLREKKRIERDIEALMPTRAPLMAALTDISSRLQSIEMNFTRTDAEMRAVSRQLEAEQRNPQLRALQADKSRLESDMAQLRGTQQQLMRRHEKAASMVDMCVKSIKYPVVLRIVKKISNRGCAGYQTPANIDDVLELEAEREAFEAVCRR